MTDPREGGPSSEVEPSEGLDAAESLRILGADAARVRVRIEPDGRVLFLVWGIAWTIGYLTLWVASRDDGVPPGWAFVVFTAALVIAIVLTAVHIARRTMGVRGASAVSGAMYGWAWSLSFVMLGVLLRTMGEHGASEELIGLMANGISCLIVGALYMAGAAIWRSWSQFALGVWIVLVGAVATLSGVPTAFLIMATAGGGGMLVGALLTRLSLRRATASR
ncbi:conserved hypothetical protein [Beutenbergia cavernae DSM 12333]|uniref:Uncharacterized protein n=1 Tax=Beutenbergia cavernae (strain ATCC BAA-8 / DSM 12333 / CCUG 43141 / JCM 11478 / NBRC 16432 / NCIMB 13614 / HKI 0122) TaxID=471853 RepID=C5C5C8_BEUC1|nr:hypothetical protein [Beutenbergia cavernae]ACQ82268.1 conserved hypothetical protein [Beutenbergia cavernae DSM 12333]